MSRLITILCLLILLPACSSQLRQPFCKNSLQSIPELFRGTYEIVVPMQSPAWSNNMILKSTRLQLAPEAALLANSSMDGGGLPSVPRGAGFRLCELSGRYFMEQRNPNGTYSITEISKFSQGLLLSSLSIDLDAAKASGYPLHYVPDPNKALKDSDWPDGLSINFVSGNFILDNSEMSSQDVLSVTKPVSMQMVLRSVASKASFEEGERIPLKKEP